MTALGNYNHNFPHLAKQSGFCFQLHKGKVNWAEIENLNVNDIVENKNFQLLEENLINVINCNLEEYDLRVSDRNFVKLFKLAQLGVDYLSYCEAYLDKCVVILQEQLNTSQEECESLKREKEKRKEEEESKRKNKNHSYQCEKCDKVFISDVYLKFHERRRHNIPSTPKRFDESPRRCTDRWQQTEGDRKSTISTQTMPVGIGGTTTAHDDADTVKIKAQDTVKVDNLEQEIQNLKDRLKKAENALTEKTENCTAGSFPSLITGPPCHNTMLLLLPSCQAQSGSSCEEVKPRILVSGSEILQQNSSQVDPKAVENKFSSESPSRFNAKSEIIISEKEDGSTKAGVKLNNEKEDAESTAEHKRQTGEGSECEKENINPNKGKASTMLSKPLPPPRKSKKAIPTRPATEDVTAVELTASPKTQPKAEAEGFGSQSAIVTSTPAKQKSSSDALKRPRESLSDLNQQRAISYESFNSRRNALVEDSSTSFFKTMMKRNSPKFRTLGQNLRRSLTNLCDSVSSTGKDFMKKESVDQNVKTPVIGRMNNRLRQMGVDPEWVGIPKKTMKQKLKALRHRRKLLTKENPMYPILRQNIEEAILQKLRKNLGRKDANMSKNPDKQAPVKDEEPVAESESIKPQNCVMYDIESDSESQTSHSEINLDQEVTERNALPETSDAKQEFDLTVFQVGGGNPKKIRQNDVSIKLEELLTDSDTDGDFSEENNLKARNKLSSDKKNGEMAEHNEGQNITLKGTHGFHSTLQLNAKKKVWFLGNSDDSEEGLSDSPTGDEDLWSLKSDWEKNVG